MGILQRRMKQARERMFSVYLKILHQLPVELVEMVFKMNWKEKPQPRLQTCMCGDPIDRHLAGVRNCIYEDVFDYEWSLYPCQFWMEQIVKYETPNHYKLSKGAKPYPHFWELLVLHYLVKSEICLKFQTYGTYVREWLVDEDPPEKDLLLNNFDYHILDYEERHQGAKMFHYWQQHWDEYSKYCELFIE